MNTTAWPADRVERRPVGALVPYARNARTHSDAQVAQIAASITEWGWTSPVLIDGDGILIAGHGRVLAAQRLGLADVPVMVATGWTKAQIAAYRLADNKLALNAGWDNEQLKIELGELDLEGFDLPLIGFGPDELAGLLDTTEGLTDPDDVPEVQLQVVTVAGDVWVLGRHRLLCGDCTSVDAIDVVMNGRRADCVFTSPPYGVGVDYGDTYQDTIDNLRQMLPMLAALWRPIVVPGGFAVVNFGDIVKGREATKSAEVSEYPMALEYWPAFTNAGWSLWSRRVWCKPGAGTGSMQCISSNRAATSWEHVWTFRQPGPYMFRSQLTGKYPSQSGWFDTTHEHKLDVKLKVHGAGMPVTVAERGLVWHSLDGGHVFEPFSGTGTTIVAAEMTGRCCHATEISPQYVDVAVRRWEAFTGLSATHERTGRTFADTANSAPINGSDEQSQARADRRTA